MPFGMIDLSHLNIMAKGNFVMRAKQGQVFMAGYRFSLDFKVVAGECISLAPDVRRITASNASPMTFTGTNTYLVGTRRLAVIDPGPDDEQHLQAILSAVGRGQHISHILVTHSHVDHSPLAGKLSSRTGAKVYAFGDSQTGRSALMAQLAKSGTLGGGEGVDHDFRPDICLSNDDVVDGDGWLLQAIATPGHFSNHLCFAYNNAVFTGDHVMGWATTMVSPPDGDLGAFMTSLEVMQARIEDQVYYPGHGAPVGDPAELISYLIRHRRDREVQILGALQGAELTPMEITQQIYTEIAPYLQPIAARNVLAHLIDLVQKNQVSCVGDLSATSRFERR